MRARDVMSTPAVTVAESTPLKEVAALFVRRAISGAPVVDAAGRLVGIVSEADLMPLETIPHPASQILARSRGPIPKLVGDVMTREVVALPPSADTAWVATLMIQKRVKRVPIVEGERVVGIISRGDLLKILARGDNEIREEVQAALDEAAGIMGGFEAQIAEGIVTLSGPSDRHDRRLAERIVRCITGVIDVRFAA